MKRKFSFFAVAAVTVLASVFAFTPRFSGQVRYDKNSTTGVCDVLNANKYIVSASGTPTANVRLGSTGTCSATLNLIQSN